jgi:hypothetical protein
MKSLWVLNMSTSLQTTLAAEMHQAKEQFLLEEHIFNKAKQVANKL